MSTLRYRADIDGLRAVAVLAVLAFHAFPATLRGGFIGVDVFFVISGYLISTILLGELAAGTFSIGGFYARRIRRIFPALLVVLAAVLLLAGLRCSPMNMPSSANIWRRGRVCFQFYPVERERLFRCRYRRETAAAPMVAGD